MEFWSQVLERIRWKIPLASYNKWFAQSEAKWDGDVIFIIVENQFKKDWLNNRYKKLIASTVQETFGKEVEIQIVSKDEQNHLSTDLLKAPYEEIKTFIVQQNLTINKLQKKVRELEKKVVYLEQLDRIM